MLDGKDAEEQEQTHLRVDNAGFAKHCVRLIIDLKKHKRAIDADYKHLLYEVDSEQNHRLLSRSFPPVTQILSVNPISAIPRLHWFGKQVSLDATAAHLG